ncbi:MAG TPA: HD domain-containing phosphohydrolase [bacterium]|nr:HD domain-containing phosphohydrolase [bacterium]
MAKELSIKITAKTPDGIHVFKVSGTLGVEGSAGIQGLLDACLKEKVYRIVLDLQGVDFISSAGMGAFLSAVGEMRKNDGDIIFVKMQNKILTVFKTLDVLDYFIVADDVDQAVERFRGGKLPKPPSLEELTAGAAEALAAPRVPQALFSLLAAYSDVLGGDREFDRKLSQLVDVTANYMALNQCAFVPLAEDAGLVAAAARDNFPPVDDAVKSALADNLPAQGIVGAEELASYGRTLGKWADKNRTQFVLPFSIADKIIAVLVVGEKKDGGAVANEERRLLRYLGTSLNLALDKHLAASRPPDHSPGAKREIGRKAMEMETLFTVSQSLAEAIETEKMLPALLMMATGQFSTDRAVVLLRAPDGGLEVGAARGLDAEALHELTIPPQGLADVVDGHAGPALVGALAEELEEGDRRQLEPFVEKGIAALAPIRFKNRLIGIVGLGAKITGREFDADELRLLAALVNLAAVSIETARLLEKTKKNYGGLVRALISAIEAKDKYTRGHTERVTLYASALADEIGLKEDRRQDLLFGAVLHDVGYLGVPEEVLRMPNGITEEQLAELRRHPLIGADILRGIPLLRNALDGVRYHHEHYDGSGYPDGLAGEDIPLIARVIAVADSFDAMTTGRRYREAKSKEEAAREITAARGAQFDPAIADAFVRLLESGRLDIITTKRRKQEV